MLSFECLIFAGYTGADPGLFLGGGALVSCSTAILMNHIYFFFLQNTSYIRKPQVISGGRGGAHPLHPSPRSAPGILSIVAVMCVLGGGKITKTYCSRGDQIL